MTNEVISNAFDTLLNSYATKSALGDQDGIRDIRLDEYEKSVFLTKAQEELVISLYNGRNSSGNGFEETEELRRYLSPLVVDDVLEPIETSNGLPLGDGSTHTFFTLPDGNSEEGNLMPAVWFLVYEEVKITDTNRCENKLLQNNEEKLKGSYMEVTPVRHDEYQRLRKNPFRGANNRRALRLDLSEGNIEIVCKYKVAEYHIRYIRKPVPIDLVEGEDNSEVSELPSSLHQRILEMAVEMALRSKGIIKNTENK